jgi:hypothetical protein
MRLHTFTQSLAALVTLACLAGPAVPTASGQAEDHLRRENQVLAQRVRDLQNELDAAKRRISVLEGQLRAAAGSTGSAAPAAGFAPAGTQEVTIDESVATASPRALFAALQRSYEQAMATVPPATDYRSRTAQNRAVERWVAAANREHRRPITWTVRVLDTRDLRRYSTIRVTAVDPATHVELGSPFDVTVPRNAQSRLERLEDRDELELLLLKGTLIPLLRIADDQGPRIPGFDSGRYIGDMVEFRLAVDVNSLSPPMSEPASEPVKSAPAASAPAPPSGSSEAAKAASPVEPK